MPTVSLFTDEAAASNPRVQAVFDDIRQTRQSDFINNFWRALANQPDLLEQTWSRVKQVMVEPGTLDPLTKELIYIAVSTINSCTYCTHSHTAAARAKGHDRRAARRPPSHHQPRRPHQLTRQRPANPHRSAIPR